MERYEAYKDSGVEWIGEIPASWNLARSGHFIRLHSGESLDSLLLDDDNNIPVYGGGGIKGYYTESNISAGSIIVSRQGATCGTTRYITTDAWATEHALVVYPQKPLDMRWVAYWLEFEQLGQYSMASAQPGISAQLVENMPMFALGMETQQAIADFLDAKTAEIDALVADCEREVELLQEYRKAVISEAVTKGLDPDAPMKDSGIEWIGKYSISWDYLKLGYTFDRLFDIDHWMPESTNEGFPYLMIGDLEELASRIDFDSCKHISEEDYFGLAVKGTPKRGDVIIARYATIGTGCFVDIDEPFIVSYACLTVTPRHESMRGRYLLYYTQSDAFERELFMLTNSNTQGNVGKDSLSKAHILLPPIDEQDEIVAALDASIGKVDELILSKQSMADKLREYRRSLISEAVTGKFKVPGIE